MENLNVLQPVAGAVLAASTQRSVGIVLVVLLALAGVALLWFNSRAARPELGAELELAPNRKPYYPDEDLEGRVLDRVLLLALILIALIAVGLPAYWLAEPGRQSGAEENYESDTGQFANQGAGLFAASAAGGLGCADCHGSAGQGGVRQHILLNPEGEFVAQVNWNAPAVNAATLRYDDDELRYILNYGRPGTPMAAWGAPGGGPLTTQQIDHLIRYLHTIERDPDEVKADVTAEVGRSLEAGEFESLGEAVFNYGRFSGADSGTYSCARCHTMGFSYGDPQAEGGGGTIGPPLRDGYTLRRFPAPQDHIDFVTEGSEQGAGYGVNGQGTGRMPGFGQMLTEDQIAAVVEYERGL
ncbi:MAG: c-type cytochrome [Acidimicrobiia bacterium]|nr:c-type cytochrome [Acidimicrobiia bacterium]